MKTKTKADAVAKLQITCDNIDRLITVEMRGERGHGLPSSRGVISKLYEAARTKAGGPLTFKAAQDLVKAVKPEDTVIITTGFQIPFWFPKGETDGIAGSVSIARGIGIGLEAKTLLVTEEPIADVLKATSKAAFLRTFGIEDMQKLPRAICVQDFSLNENEAKKTADALLDALDPSAVIAVEKIGRNEKGVYHSGLGKDMSKSTAKVDFLIEKARERGVLTIGIGDLGNEIGMGNIQGAVKELVPYGAKCRCPCGGGMATMVETDDLIVAAVSDVGAHGLVAALSCLLGNNDVLHDADLQRRMMEESVRAGGMDGATVSPTISVDEVPMNIHMNLIEILSNIVRVRTAKYPLRGHRD